MQRWVEPPLRGTCVFHLEAEGSDHPKPTWNFLLVSWQYAGPSKLASMTERTAQLWESSVVRIRANGVNNGSGETLHRHSVRSSRY